jgi:hypothetical protein
VTTTDARPTNSISGSAYVGVQGQNITVEGDVRLTVGQDATSETMYEAGVNNLKSGNPGTARELIWKAIMSDHTDNHVFFHWLLAMLSGRTVREFSTQEIEQLKKMRPRYTCAASDAWAPGVGLLSQLLDAAIPSLAADDPPTRTDLSTLKKEFDRLEAPQRDLIRPHLELFLTGQEQDELWQDELKLAQSRQLADQRLERAWMFYQPFPKSVVIPPPWPARISPHRLAMRASAGLFAAVIGYLGWELLWHAEILGLLGYVACLSGGIVAAAADLEQRFLDQQRRRKDERYRAPAYASERFARDELTDRVDALFKRYFRKDEPDETARKRWEEASSRQRVSDRNEIIEMCRLGGIFDADEVRWLIRYRVHQLHKRWRNPTLHDYRQTLRTRPGTALARWTGLAVLLIGGAWTIFMLWGHLLADVTGTVALLVSGIWAWNRWLHVALERKRFAADAQERDLRQARIDEEFARWCGVLKRRPSDEQMATWLECDRTVLLGKALDHFHLSRNRLIVHALLEEPGVAARRRQVQGGQMRYERYQILAFLLAEDGVRQVRSSLDFTTGTLVVRERRSYRYEAIVSVRVTRKSESRQSFELKLTSGDLISLRIRSADSQEPPQDEDPAPETDENEGEEEDSGKESADDKSPLDVASMASTLHLLEGIAAEGQKWLREREWAKARSGDGRAESAGYRPT